MATVLRYVRTRQRQVKTGQRVRLNVTVNPVAVSVFNRTSRFGNYARTTHSGGNLCIAYSPRPTPPFDGEFDVTNTADTSEGRFIITERQHLIAVYSRSGSVYERVSYDDGTTWTGETLIAASRKHPDIASSPDGLVMRGWWQSAAVPALRLTRQYPGDASPSSPLDAFDADASANLDLSDNVFHLAGGVDGRWWLHCIKLGAANTTLHYSTDDGATWKATDGAVTGFTSGAHPGIVAGYDGTLYAWAVVSGKLHLSRRFPGDTSWSAPAAVKDDAGADLLVESVPMSLALAWEGPRRLVLATFIDGQTLPSDWWSADDGATFKQH